MRGPPGSQRSVPQALPTTFIPQNTQATSQAAPADVLAMWRASDARAHTADLLTKLLVAIRGGPPPSAVPRRRSNLPGGETTLMVHNVPAEFSLQDLLEEWPIDGSYDYVYLPRTSCGRRALGIAFVNFKTSAHAEAFRARWHCQRFTEREGRKRLRVVLADVQGLGENVKALRSKPLGRLRRRQSLPLILRNGEPVSIEDF